MLIDAEARGVGAQRLDVFRIEMKVASGGQLQPVADFILQAFAQMLDAGIIEVILAAAMRGGHNMRDAVVDRRFGHGQRFFDTSGAVIKAWQNVAMQIDHEIRELLARSHERTRTDSSARTR